MVKRENISYLLFFGVEFDQLLQEDHKKGDTDHAHEAHTDASNSSKMGFRVEISVAYGSHCDKAHPQRIEEIAKVLRVAFKRIGLFARLHD